MKHFYDSNFMMSISTNCDNSYGVLQKQTDVKGKNNFTTKCSIIVAILEE